MVEFKLVISNPETGQSMQKEIKDDLARPFVGLSLGNSVKGEVLNLTGYEFQITGGSDVCGIPMRRGIQVQRKRILLSKGVGVKAQKRGTRLRKTVCGEKIHEKIVQINLKVTKKGKEEIFVAKEAGAEKKEAPKKE